MQNIMQKKVKSLVSVALLFLLYINNTDSLATTLPDFVKNNYKILKNSIETEPKLLKAFQGQTPSLFGSPGSSPSQNVKGLQQAVTQKRISDNGDTGWVNYKKECYTFDSEGNITKVTIYFFNDTTQIFDPSFETEMTYNAKGKLSTLTDKEYSKGQWNLSSILTLGYNAVDSLSTFSLKEWDTTLGKWNDRPDAYGAITYNSNGKVTLITDTILSGNSIYYAEFSYTYLPDGRLDTEDTRIVSIVYDKVKHFYPDPYIEIVVTEGSDSTIKYYNQNGLVDSSVKYYIRVFYEPYSRKYTTYDSQNRPVVKYSAYWSYNSLQGYHWFDNERTVYYYDDSYVKDRLYHQNHVGKLNGHKVSENTFVIKGLPEISAPATVELFNLSGITLQEYNVTADAHGCIQIRLKDFLPKGYYTFRIKQGNKTERIGLKYRTRQ